MKTFEELFQPRDEDTYRQVVRGFCQNLYEAVNEDLAKQRKELQELRYYVVVTRPLMDDYKLHQLRDSIFKGLFS